MRLSSLLGKTLRQPPSDAHLVSHQLLVRAGYLRSLEAGLFAYLPLGQCTLDRLQSLTRHQLVRRGGQEIDVPSLPDRDPTTTLVRLVRREVDSYRQLPVLLHQMLFRSVPQPASRAGLFGASERPFADVYTFGPTDMIDSDGQTITGRVRAAIDEVLASCSLPAAWAEAGDEGCRAYYSHPSGDDDLVRCPACGHAEERSWATTSWPKPPDEAELPTEEIATPGCDTIASLAEFLEIPASRTLKMVFYSVEGGVNCVVIRGDRAVDETKLARVLGTDWYYTSLEDELDAVGAIGGYASPIGLDSSRVRVIADPSVRSGKNYVSGANRPDFHIQNVNVPRDFEPGDWADLALIEPGDACSQCGSPLEIEPGFALAQSSPVKPCSPEAEYLDSGGRSQPLWMASWQLDLGRLMAAIIEEHHDDYGIVWPTPCAPFDIHLLGLDIRKENVAAQAEALYDRLQAEGFRVLFDDRNASAGVKFNDADLIGIPLRLTVSKRSAKEDLIEAKWRAAAERLKLDTDGLAAELSRLRGA
jgi:prolyl-tRNA synthetase